MSASPTELALPEGSRRIFDQILPLVVEFIPPEHVLLGGGTALAARWHPRESFDIDLFTSHVTFTEGIYRKRARFKARLEERRYSEVAMLGPDGCTLYLNDAKVDIVASPPLTHPNRSLDCVTSPTIALETSLEILAKNLHRRMILHGRILPRDLYDLAYARRFERDLLDASWSAQDVDDPQVLAAALSSFNPGWMHRHEEPVINPRYPDLRENAVHEMLDDTLSRFPMTRSPWGRLIPCRSTSMLCARHSTARPWRARPTIFQHARKSSPRTNVSACKSTPISALTLRFTLLANRDS